MNPDKKQVITACAFIYNGNKLLIVKRSGSKKFLPNKYELPGGHIEFGESAEDGLKREIKEELHADVVLGNPFFVFTYVSQDKTEHSIEIDYFAKLTNNEQKIILNQNDHSEFKWITEDEIGTYFEDNDKEKRAVEKGFQILNTLPQYLDCHSP